MTKDKSLQDAGKALANINALFSFVKGELPKTGINLDDFMGFLVQTSTASDAMRDLMHAYHCHRLIKTNNRNRNIVHVRTDVMAPRGPGMEGEPGEEGRWVELAAENDELFINSSRVELHQTPCYNQGCQFTCKDIASTLHAESEVRMLSSHFMFALLNHPHMIPSSWHEADGRGDSPFIVFLGSKWSIDRRPSYQYIRNYGEDDWMKLWFRDETPMNTNLGTTPMMPNKGTVVFPVF